jgi:hypothetical protein
MSFYFIFFLFFHPIMLANIFGIMSYFLLKEIFPQPFPTRLISRATIPLTKTSHFLGKQPKAILTNSVP